MTLHKRIGLAALIILTYGLSAVVVVAALIGIGSLF